LYLKDLNYTYERINQPTLNYKFKILQKFKQVHNYAKTTALIYTNSNL